MRKLLKLIFLVPLAIVLILLSVANRQTTTFSLDPTNIDSPAVAVELPLFVLLFIAVMLGAFSGAAVTWFSQGKYRKELREKSFETTQLKREKEEAEKTSMQNSPREIAPGLPLISRS